MTKKSKSKKKTVVKKKPLTLAELATRIGSLEVGKKALADCFARLAALEEERTTATNKLNDLGSTILSRLNEEVQSLQRRNELLGALQEGALRGQIKLKGEIGELKERTGKLTYQVTCLAEELAKMRKPPRLMKRVSTHFPNGTEDTVTEYFE